MAHGPLSMCPEAGQRTNTDLSRKNGASRTGSVQGRKCRDGYTGRQRPGWQCQKQSYRSRDAGEQPSNTDLSRPTGIPTVWGKRLHRPPYYRPCREKRRWVRARASLDRQSETANTDPTGKNTDPVGKGEPLDRGRRTVRCCCSCNRCRIKALFRGKIRAFRHRIPITDPVGRDYRHCGERIPVVPVKYCKLVSC